MSSEKMNEKEFAKRVDDVVSYGHVCLAVAMGQQLGLFEHVTAAPRTPAQIADSAGYKEKYVHCWLKAVAVAGLVEYNKEETKFWIPEEHRKYLSKTSTSLMFSNGVLFLADGFHEVIKCFPKDGPLGVPYFSYPHFSPFVSTITDQYQTENRLVTGYLAAVPGVVDSLRAGARHLDIGCGRGTPSFTIAKTFPKSESIGIDAFSVSIDFANERARQAGLSNLRYEVHDAAQLPAEWANSFDYVTTFDVLSDVCFPEEAVREAFRVLKPGRYFSILEINASRSIDENRRSMKLARVFYTINMLHCVPVSSQEEGAAGLGPMVGHDVFVEMAKKVGFVVEKVEPMPDCDYFNVHCICKKPA